MRKTGELDEERKIDLVQGSAAATSILFRANEAVSKEQRLAAVSELQSRVEDWKGHQIDHFGELLLFGDYTVVKGEGAKEVEREVCIVFDSLNPECRSRIKRATRQLSEPASSLKQAGQKTLKEPPLAGVQNIQSSSNLKTSLVGQQDADQPTPSVLRRFTSELPEVPEEDSDKADDECYTESSSRTPSISTKAVTISAATSATTTPVLRGMSSKTMFTRSLQSSVSREGLGARNGSAPPTPSRKSKMKSPGLLSDFGQIMRKQRQSSSAALQTAPKAVSDPLHDLYLLAFNRCLAGGMGFHGPKFWQIPEGARDPAQPQLANVDAVTRIESDFCEMHKLIFPVRVQYKVYLFERILLCCKEINPNKPKNKMMGNNRSLVDKKGKPRLQLKGRIFMQNVTDVVTVVKSGRRRP